MDLPPFNSSWDSPPHRVVKLADGTLIIVRADHEMAPGVIVLVQVAGLYLTGALCLHAIHNFMKIGVFIPTNSEGDIPEDERDLGIGAPPDQRGSG